MLFNDGWAFQLAGDADWQRVDLPHDWLIRDTKNLYAGGVGRYRKNLRVEALGRKRWLRFDGVYMDSALYVNGKKAGEWKNGYTAFCHEITPFLRVGDNDILVEVTYQPPNSRWYSGAGIYRDCWLVEKNATHFALDGIYVNVLREADGRWRVCVASEVVGAGDGTCTEQHYIEGLPAEKDGCDLLVRAPRLWDIGAGHRYTLVSELRVRGEVVDTVQTRFGFREVALSPAGGLVLNGRRVEIFGVCQHHDLGGLGAAVSKDALRRQLDILREMGVNAIRTAHNPPAAAFMELADEMGFLVQSEFTDVWRRSKTANDYARFFDEWAARDVAAWIRRDRNSPSVIMWSLGNEIHDTHADAADGAATMQFLLDEVAKNDPRRNAIPTFCSNYLAWENTQKCADLLKVVGYNYAEHLYHGHHAQYPDWVIYGGETASTVQSRGVYHFPLSKSILSDDDLQCSALGNSTTGWGARNSEACIIDHRDALFSPGQFLWTGFDYIGEPTPYSTKNSYFGQVDTAGFPKDSYYIYQAAWTPFDVRPTLHLFPHWDWNDGQPIDVRIASNAPRVELFLNGKSLGARDIDQARGTKRGTDGAKLTADYIVPYEAGEIRAVAYNHDGEVVMETARRSFGDAAALRTQHTVYGALTFTEITAVDADGNPVENANNKIRVTAERGKLLALDNGDSTDYDPYQPAAGEKSLTRRLFAGKLLAITQNLSQTRHLRVDFNPSYIPVRTIKLTQNVSFSLKTRILPPEASDDTLHWRLTDAAGVDSPLGTLIVGENGKSAQLIPKGDGEVFVRAAAHNGKTHPDFISVLPITLAGFGKGLLDPYQFVSGGLHNRSNGTMGNGHDRGVATMGGNESHIGFADVDFGTYGSDEVTFWLFPLEGQPFDFDIFLGMPDDGGTRLYTAHYDKGSQWNVYKQATFTLPQRITGVQTLCLIFRRNVHIKGWQFAPPKRAFARLPFTTHDEIYGDAFIITDAAVEGVGNNVSIAFREMDFTEAAATIRLVWRAARENTIRLVFTPDDGAEITNLLTAPAQADYADAEFPLDIVLNGRGTLRFIFLPGTEIDLKEFQLS